MSAVSSKPLKQRRPHRSTSGRSVGPLSWQVTAYVNEYLRSFRPTKAALAAGYTGKNAASAGSHMLLLALT
jgi:hypothetical protein